jgi:hypothetical protein
LVLSSQCGKLPVHVPLQHDNHQNRDYRHGQQQRASATPSIVFTDTNAAVVATDASMSGASVIARATTSGLPSDGTSSNANSDGSPHSARCFQPHLGPSQGYDMRRCGDANRRHIGDYAGFGSIEWVSERCARQDFDQHQSLQVLLVRFGSFLECHAAIRCITV